MPSLSSRAELMKLEYNLWASLKKPPNDCYVSRIKQEMMYKKLSGNVNCRWDWSMIFVKKKFFILLITLKKMHLIITI